MDKNSQNDKAIQTLEKNLPVLLSNYPSVLAVYLFGSLAQGVSRSLSDIDIAIRLADGHSPESCFDIRTQLITVFEKQLGQRTDVVILNNASLKFIHQIVGKGKLLFTQNRENELDYIVKKQKEYFDFKYYIEKDIHEMKTFFGVPE